MSTIILVKKAAEDIPITITGVPVGRTVDKVYLSIKRRRFDIDASALVLKNTSTIDNSQATVATCTITIAASDLDSVSPGSYEYTVKAILDNSSPMSTDALHGYVSVRAPGVDAVT